MNNSTVYKWSDWSHSQIDIACDSGYQINIHGAAYVRYGVWCERSLPEAKSITTNKCEYRSSCTLESKPDNDYSNLDCCNVCSNAHRLSVWYDCQKCITDQVEGTNCAVDCEEGKTLSEEGTTIEHCVWGTYTDA